MSKQVTYDDVVTLTLRRLKERGSRVDDWKTPLVDLVSKQMGNQDNRPKHDPVLHPRHYTMGGVEVIAAIDAWFKHESHGFYFGNIIKYVARAGKKNNRLEDLRKAKFYLDRLIDKLTEEGK